ncbi:hypothetical protein P3T39_004338 [Kitasatospora sp. GP82]|nr:hypothetical protein [Kitasatospora sp. GP82]
MPGEAYPHAWIVHLTPLKDPAGLVHGVQPASLDFSEQHATANAWQPATSAWSPPGARPLCRPRAGVNSPQ